MNEWKFGNKVLELYVKPQGRGYFSCARMPENGGVEYLPNQVTKPAPLCGPLTVFESRNDAERFAQRLNHGLNYCFHVVLPCLYRESRDQEVWSPLVLEDGGSWPTGQQKDYLPEGTRLADEVWILDQ